MLGSLNIVGNPLAFISSITKAFTSLIQLPSQEIANNPNHNKLIAITKGLLSFSSHITRGSLISLYSLTSSLSNTTAITTTTTTTTANNDNDNDEDEHSILHGIKLLSQGVMNGAIGTIIDPYKGIKEKGMLGLIQGIGSGLIGIVTKPISGALGLVAETSLSLSSKLKSAEEIKMEQYHITIANIITYQNYIINHKYISPYRILFKLKQQDHDINDIQSIQLVTVINYEISSSANKLLITTLDLLKQNQILILFISSNKSYHLLHDDDIFYTCDKQVHMDKDQIIFNDEINKIQIELKKK